MLRVSPPTCLGAEADGEAGAAPYPGAMSTAADSEHSPAAEGATTRPLPAGASGGDADGGAASPAESAQHSPAAAAPRGVPASAGLVFDDPLDRPSSDDTDRGWGDPLSGSADDDFSRFLSEKPPHHL